MEPLQELGKVTAKAAPASLLGLIHMRTSQINGCAVCLELHVQMKHSEETPERIMTLAAWRDAPYFTDAERAALAVTEAVTHLGNGVPDDVWAEAAKHFDEPTLAAIVTHIAIVNLYNRINVATKQVAGAVKWS
jgi:AhpD family alkylhydroperoxidase